MLRRPLGLSQAALARPSHCGHTLWAHIEVITHNVEVVGTKFLKKSIYPVPPKWYGDNPQLVTRGLRDKTPPNSYYVTNSLLSDKIQTIQKP